MTDPPSDHDLLRGIARRDVASLRHLFDRYAPIMLAIARRVLHDEHEAEDVVNEVFLELWSKPDRFVAERGAPRTYLLLIVRSRSIDKLRSRGSGTRGKTRTGPAPEPVSEAPGPHEAAEFEETRLSMRRLLDELPEAQRQAVSMSFMDGLTHQEIADQLQQPLGTIKGRIRQGLIRLRDELRNQRGGGTS